MQEQTIFDLMYPKYKVIKPIRLITLFSGYDSQALALKQLGIDFEHWKTCEWAVKSIQALKDLHFENDNNDYSATFDIDYIKKFLLEKGISQNYNEPLNEQQINKMSEHYARNIFNNILATHNLVNIQQVKGKDLEIVEPDKYCYLMTYSFPCQDLSLAGKRAGFSDTSTRSGMLWEVERILAECKENGNMPEILLMENVIQIHSEENKQDFLKWILRLEELGYKNYWQDLIATDYGIPQTRNRCFMISILGDYSYSFPPKQELKVKLKDLLEDQVDEKYFLSDKMIDYVSSRFPTGDSQFTTGINMSNRNTSEKAGTITTGEGSKPTSNYIIENEDLDYDRKQGKIVKVKSMKSQQCNELIRQDKVKENDTLYTNFITRRIKENDYIQNNNISPTLTTSTSEIGVCVGTYDFSSSDNFMNNKDRFKKDNGTFPTLLTEPKKGVVVKEPKVLGGVGEKKSNGGTQWYQQDRVYDDKVAIAVTTTCNPYYKNNLRIRKLTPRECFRLIGVSDQNYEKIAKNQSDSSLFHLAGDSIVVNVLVAIFKELL